MGAAVYAPPFWRYCLGAYCLGVRTFGCQRLGIGRLGVVLCECHITEINLHIDRAKIVITSKVTYTILLAL